MEMVAAEEGVTFPFEAGQMCQECSSGNLGETR